MDMSARRAVSLWVPMTESFIHTMRLLVAAGSERQNKLAADKGCVNTGGKRLRCYWYIDQSYDATAASWLPCLWCT
jgi:hypothetical protein